MTVPPPLTLKSSSEPIMPMQRIVESPLSMPAVTTLPVNPPEPWEVYGGTTNKALEQTRTDGQRVVEALRTAEGLIAQCNRDMMTEMTACNELKKEIESARGKKEGLVADFNRRADKYNKAEEDRKTALEAKGEV